MEDQWKTSPCLNDCRYLLDIDVETPKQRSKAGLPSKSLVWPNTGDKLVNLPEIAGLQTPFAYVAGDKFGAIFNCHRDDFDLHSINLLYTGRKIWTIISQEKFKNTAGYCSFPCSQVLRHNHVSFTQEQLKELNIPYHVVDQQAGQFVITFPKAYHQGFSPASSVAEAINYAREDRDYTDYKACNGDPCPHDAITLDWVEPQSSGTGAALPGE